MVRLKRCLCLVLALALLLTWPGFLPQKAEAIAIADDAAVLSLALLFTTWAGITFTQSDQAVTAMKTFLSTKTASAASLAGLITKNLVVEGTKLLITGDVRSAFGAVLPEIRDFFKVDSDVVASTCSGSLSGSSVVGPWYDVPILNPDPYFSELKTFFPSKCILPVADGYEYEFCFVSKSGSSEILTGRNESNGFFIRFSNGSSYKSIPFGAFFFPFLGISGSKTYGTVWFPYVDENGVFTHSSVSSSVSVASATFRIVSAPDTVDFKQSQTVNGSSVSSSLDSADLDTANASISIAPVTNVVSSGVAGSTAAPGLSAEDYERILADALAGTAVLPTTPDPTTAEPTETTPEEDKEHILTPDIFNTGLSGLKESFSSWWSGVQSWFELKIQAFQDWLSAFWASLITAVTVTIPNFLSGIADVLSTFCTVTFPAWITDVKDWAQTLPKVLGEALVAALAAAFVPSLGFVDAKVGSLVATFPFANSIIASGKELAAAFTGFYTEPPIIYAELHNAVSPYSWGDRAIILDLRWYAQYKPTVDTLISGFLWAVFIWKIFQKLSGIISGMPGDFVMDGVNGAGMVDHLPTRKEAYETQRVNNHELFWRKNKK